MTGVQTCALPISSRLRAVAWVAFAAHLFQQFTPALRELPSVGHFFHALGWVAMGLLYLSYLQGGLSLAHALVFFGVAMPLELLGLIGIFCSSEAVLRTASGNCTMMGYWNPFS